ncbi:hypothetical protein KRM28CT15_32310 [Krasilnikovia sp. M28-CT-15]
MIVAAAGAALAAMMAVVTNLPDSSAEKVPAPPSTPAPFLVDADSNGAIVFDLAREVIVGYDRSGKVIWQDPAMTRSAYVTCLASCPDAVASGALRGPESGDGWPEIVRSGSESHTRQMKGNDLVLLARSAQTRVVLERRPEGAALVNYHDGRAQQRLPLSTPKMPLITAGPTGELLILSRDESSSTIFLVRPSGTGWVITPENDEAAVGGCVNRQSHAIVYADHAVVIGKSGRKTVPQPHVGACHLVGDTLLAETMSVGPSGHRSLVRYWDLRLDTGWTMEGADKVSADLDPTGQRAAVVQGTVATIRSEAGSQVVRDVVDARYAEDGSLVLLHPDASVSRR